MPGSGGSSDGSDNRSLHHGLQLAEKDGLTWVSSTKAGYRLR
jgi:hypothetical protein